MTMMIMAMSLMAIMIHLIGCWMVEGIPQPANNNYGEKNGPGSPLLAMYTMFFLCVLGNGSGSLVYERAWNHPYQILIGK